MLTKDGSYGTYIDEQLEIEMRDIATKENEAFADEFDGFDMISGAYSVLSDDIDEQVSKIRKIVLKYAPAIEGGSRDIRNAKSINAFINKHSLHVVKETVIAIVDTTIMGDGERGFLFTTHAIYYKTFLEKVVKIAYSDIIYEKCELIRDKKGKPASINIARKGLDAIKVVDVGECSDALIDMFIEIGKLSKFALTDLPQPIYEMNYSVKLPFVKLMVNFMNYSNQPYIELMRFACDIGFTNEQLTELAKYIIDPKESHLSILAQINKNVPYPSRKSLRYALLTEMLSLLQLVKGSFNESALEHEFIQKTARLYGFSSEDIANLKVLAQVKYKIIAGQIKSYNEFEEIQNSLTGVALAGGVSLVTVLGSSFLFGRMLYFLPGIGTILAGGNIVFAVINKIKNDAKLSEQRKQMIDKELESYKSAIDRLSHLFPGMVKEIMLLKKHIAWLRTMK